MAHQASVPLLEVRALRCERDERLLFEDVQFELRAGEVMQVAGPNGCGKTTMLRTIAGLSQRCTGRVTWRGEDIGRARYDYLRESLYLGHEAAINPALTPVESLRWHASLWGRVRPLAIEEALARTGLAGYLHTPAQRLSAGQKRRIALARLLLSPATLWILDEPFTAIDLAGVAELESLIAAHAAAGGAVLLTTHHRLAIADGLRRLTLGQQMVD
jgi:heme exporter protein A